MWRLGLRGKMAASYVLVTATAVLLVEAVIVGLYLIPQANASGLEAVLREQAGRDTKVIGLEIARLSSVGPGRTDDELLEEASRHGSTLAGGQWPGRDPGLLEAVVGMDGVIVASSAPEVYAVGARLDVPLPRRVPVAPTAPAGRPLDGRPGAEPVPPPEADLPGRGHGGRSMTRTGPANWYFSPVFSSAPANDAGFGTIGYVYVQAPADADATPPFESALPMIVPGVAVLGAVVPLGLVFGLLSTRRLTSRVRRLAGVTTAVAGGDFGPRVPVTGADEVSTLEQSVNVMADRLGAAVAAAGATARAEARQAERGRIARELHDSISQDLFSLSLLAGGMRRAAPGGLREQAEAMERTAGRAMREMQALLLELRPVALEDAGLVPALEELCHAYQARLGVRVEADLAEVALAPAAEHAVLRLVQEALGNAIKHAEPEAITVRLHRRDGHVTVEVSDDGVGFDPAGVAGRHGMGLTLMRERMTELGARLEIDSGRNGTTVRASLP